MTNPPRLCRGRWAVTIPAVTRLLESRRVDLGLGPLEVLRAWPAAVPAAALISGFPGGVARSRWSIIAAPGEWVPIDRRGTILPASRGAAAAAPDSPPFVGGWIGYLGYELGGVLEPRAARRGGGSDGALGGWARCESAFVHDNATGRWWLVGDADDLPRVEELRERAADAARGVGRTGFAFDGPLRSEMGRGAYVRAVARAVEYIRAGDVFQVNLAHMLCGRMRGSPRELFAALARSAAPWYGALLETPWGVIASASPELFLDFDARTRGVVTRPMKGTRAGERGAAELLASEKDAAELNMIVDLMRNDLGRVCEFGSVRVDAEREVEAHGRAAAGANGAATGPRGGGAGGGGGGGGAGVLQGVATVSGVVRAGCGLEDLLRAAFPPGSITGAPKVRAMQIIDELEGGAARGPYCGCVGFVSDSGRAQFSVAIRTAVLTPAGEGGEATERRSDVGTEGAGGASKLRPRSSNGELSGDAGRDVWDVRYGVGAGIVADSDPESEWRETLVKARIWQGIASVAEE